MEAKYLDGDMITPLKKDSKVKKYSRVIYLNEVALDNAHRLAKEYPKGALRY